MKDLLIISLIWTVFSVGCAEDSSYEAPLQLILKVNGRSNIDTLDMWLGDSVELAWMCRQGKVKMDVLTVHPADLFWGHETLNGDLLTKPDSNYVADFEGSRVYGDALMLRDLRDTVQLSFTLKDESGEQVSRQLLIYLNDTISIDN